MAVGCGCDDDGDDGDAGGDAGTILDANDQAAAAAAGGVGCTGQVSKLHRLLLLFVLFSLLLPMGSGGDHSGHFAILYSLNLSSPKEPSTKPPFLNWPPIYRSRLASL